MQECELAKQSIRGPGAFRRRKGLGHRERHGLQLPFEFACTQKAKTCCFRLLVSYASLYIASRSFLSIFLLCERSRSPCFSRYVVYFLQAQLRKGVKGATHDSSRDYIGMTQKPLKDRAKEHMASDSKKAKNALWLTQATIVGDPVVTERPLAGSVCFSTVTARKLMFAPGWNRSV